MNIIVLFPKNSERRLVMFTKPVLKKSLAMFCPHVLVGY